MKSTTKHKRSRLGELNEKYANTPIASTMKGAIDIEQLVLGGIIAESRILPNIQELFRPEYFSSPRHELIANIILELYNEQKPIDLVTVIDALRSKGKKALEDVGGPSGVSSLVIGVGSNVNTEYHLRIIHQKHMERQTVAICENTIKSITEGKDVFECMDEMANAANQLSSGVSIKQFSDMFSLHQKFLERKRIEREKSGVIGVPSGFQALDRITGGWKKGRMITIAARPAMGKSAFALCMARNAAVMFGFPVAVFSAEMTEDENYTRLITAEYNVQNLDHATLQDQELDHINDNADVKKLIHAPIYIDDSANLSIFELRSKARKIKKEKGIEMIIIDYLQLMSGSIDDSDHGRGNREQEISKISRGIKMLAKELDIPIIALAQLSRAVETRGGDKKPILSDLRESGSIEQDSDVVGFLWRPEYYGITDIEGEPTAGLTHVIIAKHRGGKVGYVELEFVDHLTKFKDYIKPFAPNYFN